MLFWCQLFGTFFCQIHQCGNAPLQDHLVPPVAQKLREDPWPNLGVTTKPWKLGLSAYFWYTFFHYLAFACISFWECCCPRLKTLLTSCSPLRGPAFYRPFVKLDTACWRHTVMMPPLWKGCQVQSSEVLSSNAALEGSLLGTSKWCSCELKGLNVLQCQSCPWNLKLRCMSGCCIPFDFWLPQVCWHSRDLKRVSMQSGCVDGDICTGNYKDSLVFFLYFLIPSRNIVVRRYVRWTKDNCWKLSTVWKEKIIVRNIVF